MSASSELQAELESFREDFQAIQAEIGKAIVGHEEVIQGVLAAMIAGGHSLLEGLPGTGKTALARALADAVDLAFQRIQCTPDLVPTDVIGTYVIMETPQGRRTFEFQKGPLFANIVLADHINRTLPKTQAALLEAMDEGSVTVSTETFALPEPYLVIATQNPLEMEGTYPLPEAELDRFLFKLVVRPPSVEQMEAILDRTTEETEVVTRAVVDGPRLLKMGRLARKVAIADEVRRFGVAVVAGTHPDSDRAPETVRRFVRHGASPRGAQAMILGAKVLAVLDGRYHVSVRDLAALALPALRHRVVLNFDGQAEGIGPDEVIQAVLDEIPEPGGPSSPEA